MHIVASSYKFLSHVGTSDLSNYFYGHVDHDLGSKWESWYKSTFPTALEYVAKPTFNRRIHETQALLCTIIYYLGRSI